MSYNSPRNYNTRHSGRFNRPGSFVPATSTNHHSYEVPLPPAPAPAPAPAAAAALPPPLAPPAPPVMPVKGEDEEMSAADSDNQSFTSGSSHRMPFFKTKLTGVKKISNKERRRRQNALLRRLATPKNALMCINEMLPHEQIANQFKVELAPVDSTYYTSGTHSFCAELALDGRVYKGYGESKLTARNAAAEQAIRDIVLKKMQRCSEGGPAAPAAPAAPAEGAAAEEAEEAEAETEALPMIQLLSFALHKLFAEWEGAGHHVPQLRPARPDRAQSAMDEDMERAAPPAAPAAPRLPKDRKLPPDNASSMHPAMLLTMMRPMATYRELGTEGDKPQNMLFSVGVDVDGHSFYGKAPSKKEARKKAARAACRALLGVSFDDEK